MLHPYFNLLEGARDIRHELSSCGCHQYNYIFNAHLHGRTREALPYFLFNFLSIIFHYLVIIYYALSGLRVYTGGGGSVYID